MINDNNYNNYNNFRDLLSHMSICNILIIPTAIASTLLDVDVTFKVYSD